MLLPAWSRKARALLLLSLAAAMSSMTAAACTSAWSGASTNVSIDTWNDPTPDKQRSGLLHRDVSSAMHRFSIRCYAHD